MALARYTILIANRKTGAVRRLTMARVPIILTCVALLTMAGFVGLLSMGMTRSDLAELDGLKVANENLKLENESYRAAAGELASQISSLQMAMRQLAEQAQLDPATLEAMEKLPAMVKSQAMGGSAVPADLIAKKPTTTTGHAAGTLGVLRDLLGVLEDRLASVRTRVEGQQALARATPTLWPMLGVWYTSGFGARKDPFTGQQEYHTGIDLAADKGTPIRATADGTVESVGYNGNYGNSILMTHGFGISTRFGHMSRFAVAAGQRVKRGDVIGFVGATGRATSPHLHYEILFNGTPTNPLRLLVGSR